MAFLTIQFNEQRMHLYGYEWIFPGYIRISDLVRFMCVCVINVICVSLTHSFAFGFVCSIISAAYRRTLRRVEIYMNIGISNLPFDLVHIHIHIRMKSETQSIVLTTFWTLYFFYLAQNKFDGNDGEISHFWWCFGYIVCPRVWPDIEYPKWSLSLQ